MLLITSGIGVNTGYVDGKSRNLASNPLSPTAAAHIRPML
jgi:hypothetical protein